jgi:hypothetical protein
MRPFAVHSVVLALAGVWMCGITAARAGDLASPMYGPPVYAPAPYPAPNYGVVYGGGGPCRIVLERHLDPYGREIVRRARVCGEGPMYPSVAGPVPPPEYGYPGPRYYEPQPSGYYAYPPRPPAPVGPGYYN